MMRWGGHRHRLLQLERRMRPTAPEMVVLLNPSAEELEAAEARQAAAWRVGREVPLLVVRGIQRPSPEAPAAENPVGPSQANALAPGAAISAEVAAPAAPVTAAAPGVVVAPGGRIRRW